MILPGGGRHPGGSSPGSGQRFGPRPRIATLDQGADLPASV